MKIDVDIKSIRNDDKPLKEAVGADNQKAVLSAYAVKLGEIKE